MWVASGIAASLIGETIDCVALMKAGDSRDDEAGAASIMLSALQAEFGSKEFTAKDITAILDAGAPSAGLLADAKKKDKADRLLDAFGQLLGRRLRPAHCWDNRQNPQQPPRRSSDLHRRLRRCRCPEGVLGEAHEPLPCSGPSWRQPKSGRC